MPVEELTEPPRLGVLYRAAALGAVRRRASAELPDVELVRPGVAVEVDPLAEYDRVCGFRLADTVPATYPHVLAFPTVLALLTRADFPLPLPGLVHIANRIEAVRPVRVGDRLTIRVRAEDLRLHERGRQVDVVTVVSVDDAPAWEERATYLRREKDRRGLPGGGGEGSAPPAAAVWTVPADTGTRYARVSGDRNPIHTSRLLARAFGFPRRVAHGMWTAARCLAALEGRLPDAVTLETRFQRPVPLPARVGLATAADGDGWRMSVFDVRTGHPHLTGTAHPAPGRRCLD